MLNLQHKKCKQGGYERGQMPKNANVICEGSLGNIWGLCTHSIRACTKQKLSNVMTYGW